MIVLFCGIPGSGKTTTAEILAERLGELGTVEKLSSDRLRAPVYAKLFRALAPDRGRVDFLILDATFYKKEWREQVRRLARGEAVVSVYFDCSLEVALQRNRARRPNISEKAVHIMFRLMEEPRNPTLRIESPTMTAEQAAEKIFRFIKGRGLRASGE